MLEHVRSQQEGKLGAVQTLYKHQWFNSNWEQVHDEDAVHVAALVTLNVCEARRRTDQRARLHFTM